ncbi:hypothetical protein N9Z08_00235 [Pirellulales bacterium]|nr:hypothetical protein [Pirellulales bacterium]
MKHENSKSEFVRQLAQQYGTNHSTNYFVEKCRALGEDVSPQICHSVLGPYRYRAIQDTSTVVNASRKLLSACDNDITMAVRCLKIHG